MGRAKTTWRVRIEGSLPIWVMPPRGRTIITQGRSSPRAPLPMMRRVAHIAVRPGRSCGRAVCIPPRRTIEYVTRKGVCGACALRSQCTRSGSGRTVKRHEHQPLLDRARVQAHSLRARRDRKRRQHLLERSFADAANNHHFKRARWRRLWRQQIQDHLVAAVQNVRILLTHHQPKRSAAVALIPMAGSSENRPLFTARILGTLNRGWHCCLAFTPPAFT
jgi:hypothetical protein